MRRMVLWIAVTGLMAGPLAGQGISLPGPPLIPRHAHVRDGALIGASIGEFAGAIVGLKEQNALCPPRAWVCRTPQGALISMIEGLAIGGVAGGITGGLVGAFIKTSGTETQAGITLSL